MAANVRGTFAPDHLCALTCSGYQGPGRPDRADAMVWAMTELFDKERARPRITVF
jgi:phage terminase large subunit-like protein